MKKVLAVVLIVISLLLVLTPACATTEATTTPATTPGQSTTQTSGGPGTGTANTITVTGYAVRVTQGGNTLATYGVVDLDKMPQASVKADGKDYSGPGIMSILTQAGVNSFTRVTIAGYAKGRLATAELPVSRSDLNSNYILRKTNQGTFSLASPDVPADNWIIDVNELRVE